MDDGRSRILAEREDTLDGSLGVPKELQGDVFVVLGGFGVLEDLSHLLVVRAAEHEFAVMEGLLGHQREGLG